MYLCIGIYIAGVTEVYVTSHKELLGIMGAGANNRATAATGIYMSCIVYSV